MQTYSLPVCGAEFSPSLSSLFVSQPICRDAAGNIFVIWKVEGASPPSAYMLSVCHNGEWLEPQSVFPDEDPRKTIWIQGMVDIDGRFKLVRVWNKLSYEVYSVRVDARGRAPLSVELDHVVEVPPGLVHKAYMGWVSTVLPRPDSGGYLVAGHYSEKHINPFFFFLPQIPHLCTKWWWSRASKGVATTPRALFRSGWLNLTPRHPTVGRQLVAGRNGKVHAVAVWGNATLVHCWLEGDTWQVEQVYEGGRQDGVCENVFLASPGETLVVGGSFPWGVGGFPGGVVLWTKEQGVWRVALTLRDALLQDLASDNEGLLYVLYRPASHLRLELLVRGRQGWSGPFEIRGPYHGRMLVDDDGVIHVAAKTVEDDSGYYIRLERAASNHPSAAIAPVVR